MRNAIIGIIIGGVIGVVIGATVIAPRIPGPMVKKDPAGAEATATAMDTGTGTGTEKKEATGAAPAQDAKTPFAPAPSAIPLVRWKMASAYSEALPQLGPLARRVQTETWRISGGATEIRFHEPGALVPVADMFDAVSSGAIDAAFASPGLWGDRYPVLNLFGAVPFGPQTEEYLAWIYFGGGGERAESIFRKHNIHNVFCGIIAPEAAGWFRREVHTVSDLKGLRMRILGLGAKVMEKLGVETRPLEVGEIFMALESGELDAAEYSMPAIDWKLGFYNLAKHYYFPGWHQPATLLNLMINLDRWHALSDAQQGQIESVCGDNIRYSLAEGEAIQFQALKDFTAKGVKIRRWPIAVLDALKKSWEEVVDEQVAADGDFRDVWQSLNKFREDYAIWNELGRP